MRRIQPHFALLAVLIILAPGIVRAQAEKTFTVKSVGLGGQFTREYYFNDWGVGGGNLSPELDWENVPAGTQAFAVTMYDAAAPTGSGWWHWVLFNVPASTTGLKAGAASTHPELLPAGSVSSLNDFGKVGYGGPVPIPGSGFHPYVITVHALKAPLKLDKNANPALVGFNLGQNTIAKASIIAYVYVP